MAPRLRDETRDAPHLSEHVLAVAVGSATGLGRRITHREVEEWARLCSGSLQSCFRGGVVAVIIQDGGDQQVECCV